MQLFCLLGSCVITKSTSCLYSWAPWSGKQSEINKHFKFSAFDGAVLGEQQLRILRWLFVISILLTCWLLLTSLLTCWLLLTSLLTCCFFCFGVYFGWFFYYYLKQLLEYCFSHGKNLNLSCLSHQAPSAQQPWWQWSDPPSELLQHHSAESKSSALEQAGGEGTKLRVCPDSDLAALLFFVNVSLWVLTCSGSSTCGQAVK